MTILRKNLPYALLALAMMPLATMAAPPAVDTPSAAVAVDCDHRYLSQRDAARVLGTDNFSQTYAKRQSLYANLARACHTGVSTVLLVIDTQPRPKVRAVASR